MRPKFTLIKLFSAHDATRTVLCSITSLAGLVLACGTLAGCVPRPGISPERRRMALELVDRGTLLLRERRFKDAEAAFQAAYELAPIPAAVDGQGCSAFHRGDLIGAERFFRQAYGMDMNYDEALANLGLVLAVQGRKGEASEVYRSYLVRRPDAAHVRNNLTVLEYERGEATMRVESELRKASMLTHYGVIADNLRTTQGLVGAARGDPEEAGVGKNRKQTSTKTKSVR